MVNQRTIAGRRDAHRRSRDTLPPPVVRKLEGIIMVLGTRLRQLAVPQSLSVQAIWRSSPHHILGCPPTVSVMLIAVRLLKVMAAAEFRC